MDTKRNPAPTFQVSFGFHFLAMFTKYCDYSLKTNQHIDNGSDILYTGIKTGLHLVIEIISGKKRYG